MPSADLSGVLLCWDDERPVAKACADQTGLSLAVVRRHRFPDGEVRVRLPEVLPARVVIWRGLHQPNDKLVELMLVARTARSLGAQHLTLVAPYLAYMRQDMAFNPGEAVSQRIVGAFLADLFDAVVTVDPHLHRVATLQEAVPVADAIVIDGAPLLSDHIASQCPGEVLLIGPDEESLQWVGQAARRHGWTCGVCRKTRHGDREVDIALPALSVRDRAVILMDDVASSGHTLARAARLLRDAGAATVDVAVTHALFAEGALALIHGAGVDRIWSTDCIPHESNAVSIVPAVAARLRGL